MAGDEKFSKLGASDAHLATAWQDRMADANTLLAAGRHGAAIAAGIYALEILLKTRICRILKLNQLPSVIPWIQNQP
jgi:hypothetical protein